MSIRARIDDSAALHKSGRYEGAILSLLVAVAASSRKRYPKETMGDGDAFRKFLGDEMKTITGNIENLHIKYRGEVQPLQDVLYKFVRCELAHEGKMPTDFVIERGSAFQIKIDDDRATFTDGLLEGLARAVIFASENADEFKEIIEQHDVTNKQQEASSCQ